MDIDALNGLVSTAIWRAEQFDAPGDVSASRAWSEVCRLENELARAIPPLQPEGRIARRGAVRAALKAGDYLRARNLVEAYTAELDTPPSLKAALRKLLEDHNPNAANTYDHASVT